MKSRRLNPSQVIVPSEYHIWNHEILNIYFQIFNQGKGNSLSPIIVVNSNLISEEERNQRAEIALKKKYESELNSVHSFGIPKIKGYESAKTLMTILISHDVSSARMLLKGMEAEQENYSKLDNLAKKNPFYLIDGNHKCIAATLAHKKIPALELQTQGDVEELLEMEARGELLNIGYKIKKYVENRWDPEMIAADFESHVLNSENIANLRTVEERVAKLVNDPESRLPRYMINRYKQE